MRNGYCREPEGRGVGWGGVGGGAIRAPGETLEGRMAHQYPSAGLWQTECTEILRSLTVIISQWREKFAITIWIFEIDNTPTTWPKNNLLFIDEIVNALWPASGKVFFDLSKMIEKKFCQSGKCCLPESWGNEFVFMSGNDDVKKCRVMLKSCPPKMLSALHTPFLEETFISFKDKTQAWIFIIFFIESRFYQEWVLAYDCDRFSCGGQFYS